MPRVAPTRQARRQDISPLGRPRPRVHDATLMLPPPPHVDATNSTAEALAAPPRADKASDEPVSQDEAANLLLALPLSRDPSFSTASTQGQVPSPRMSTLPMSKNCSGLSVSGCLSLLDEPEGGIPPSPRLGGVPPSPRLGGPMPSPRMGPALPLTKTVSNISVSNFLAD